MICRSLFAFVVFLSFGTPLLAQPVGTLQESLSREPVAGLAKAARKDGDAVRGAMLFFQPFLGCAKCHDGQESLPLGPDLSRAGKEATAEYLIESVLTPSKAIKKGYEAVLVSLTNGRALSGLIAEENATSLTLIDPSAAGKRIVLAKDSVESRTPAKNSLMPDGLANLLSDRAQFLDLAKYLIEIAEMGPDRARELRPAQMPTAIAAYEKEIDHAGMIKALDANAYRRGEAIYTRVCANCHGTKDQAGSLPNSLRFASGAFKNGADPFAIYQTITRGYGFMAPQTWMVPQQKYDVIHYLREAYLKPHNAGQLTLINETYLASLPKGSSFGPPARLVEPWVAMDYGPSLMHTYQVSADQRGETPNIAYKGIAIRLDPGAGGVSRGRHWSLFDHDTMRHAASWQGEGFIDWKGIQFDGQHQIHPKLGRPTVVSNPVGPGWANPDTGTFEDPRPRGRDQRPYGPLPKSWAQYKGIFAYGDQTILSYAVGSTNILESLGAEAGPNGSTLYTRTFEIDAPQKELICRVAPIQDKSSPAMVALVPSPGVTLAQRDSFHILKIAPSSKTVLIKVLLGNLPQSAIEQAARTSIAPKPLKGLTLGGPRRWMQTLSTSVSIGKDDGPFAVDTFELPEKNPWNAQLRLTGFDFFPDGKRMAVCSWDGDVWVVTGIDNPSHGLTWQRIASGLFQPLGLKFRDGAIFVCCRDQIVKLHDLNGDGETDFYECFNNDHQVTEHFHEFAMGLQTDTEGNFYYAKSGRHALPALVPHHGTLLKVSKDGATTEILATGFRAANGVCLNPDGTFFVTDQEGFWTPKNRINLVEKGGFYGNMWGFTDQTDTSDAAMKQPLCWITNQFDRSPAELVHVTSNQWGPLKGSLLNISYGQGKIYVVPFEKVNGQAQGGMCALPLPLFPTGIMRGRFHPTDGGLYTCGMFAWAGNQSQPGGFYRVRPTGKAAHLPIGLKAKSDGVELSFTDPIQEAQPRDFEIKVWGLKRSQNYGSNHVNEHSLAVAGADLSPDGKTVHLKIPGLEPTRGMEIKYRLKSRDGQLVSRTIHNTIHEMPNRPAPKPVKVFLLAGQSNMEGQAVVDLAGKDYNDGNGTLLSLFNDPKKAKTVAHLRSDKGEWVVRPNVWVHYQREDRPLLAGPLSVGFTVYGDKHHFGPELPFGHLMADRFSEKVILIKTAWGGKSLFTDFRPPSSGGEVGLYYKRMIAEVRKVCDNLSHIPGYAGEGYELAGFVWYHGWNDGCDPKKAIPQYEQNLVNLIKDVRKDLKAPQLPVVIGELTGPWVEAPDEWALLRKAQAKAAACPEFQGNVLFVETHDFVRPPEQSPNPTHGHHEFGNAETYFLVGDALGRGMLRLLPKR